jgi:hypothetical protein
MGIEGKTSVILSTSKEWDTWLESIKTIAKGKDIWSYVNPETPKESLHVLGCPSAPIVSDVRPGATTIEDLSANELDDLKERRKNYRIAEQRYETRKESLADHCGRRFNHQSAKH